LADPAAGIRHPARRAAALGISVVETIANGHYFNRAGDKLDSFGEGCVRREAEHLSEAALSNPEHNLI